MFQKIINKLKLSLLKLVKSPAAKIIGIKEYKNYSNSFILLDRLDSDSIVIDVGCAEDADFAQTVIKNFNVTCFAVDPTKKHSNALKSLEREYGGLFRYLQLAVGPTNGKIVFHESKDNQSGSLLDSHINVKNDNIIDYEVESVTLSKLFDKVGSDNISMLKLDIEGAEYDLLKSVTNEDLQKVDQIFIEFHHHAIPEYDQKDTRQLVDKIINAGFSAFTYDNHNYLFYQT